jgi:hypothetical protein
VRKVLVGVKLVQEVRAQRQIPKRALGQGCIVGDQNRFSLVFFATISLFVIAICCGYAN